MGDGEGTLVIDGGVVSTTLTVNDAVALAPCVSVALHEIVCAPRPSVDPEAGSQPELATESSGSPNVTGYVTTAPELLVASTEKSPGVEIVGG